MTTQAGPPPIPIPKRHRPLDRVVILLLLFAMIIGIASTINWGPNLVGNRNQTEIAEAGVTNAVAALVTVTEDARVANLRECFRDPYAMEKESIEETLKSHTDIAYQLLRMGSQAPLDLKPFARAGLYQGYIDLGRDPWGQHYYIYFGPMAETNESTETPSVWNFDGGEDRADVPSQPPIPKAVVPPPFVAWPGAHKDGAEARAVPAPAGLPFYVICAGPNGVLDQPFMNGGLPEHGDDITSWDGYAWEVVRGNRE